MRVVRLLTPIESCKCRTCYIAGWLTRFDFDQGAAPGHASIELNMKAKDFIVIKRPKLANITKHPTSEFADYERRLESMQSIMQSIQQAYLGTRERAVVVLEGWDTAGKGGIVRRLGWARFGRRSRSTRGESLPALPSRQSPPRVATGRSSLGETD